jgi:hypothetical protein
VVVDVEVVCAVVEVVELDVVEVVVSEDVVVEAEDVVVAGSAARTVVEVVEACSDSTRTDIDPAPATRTTRENPMMRAMMKRG